MTKKKGRFFTFCCSLIPGAGEMYLGFYKQGLSLMGAFFLLLGLAGPMSLQLAVYLMPLVWFYSFFHANNLVGLPEEEFYSLEDQYLFHLDGSMDGVRLLRSHPRFIACCLIFFGASILWNSFSSFLLWYLFPFLRLSEEMQDLLRYIARSIPQAIVAIAIILAGLWLIRGKYEKLTEGE